MRLYHAAGGNRRDVVHVRHTRAVLLDLGPLADLCSPAATLRNVGETVGGTCGPRSRPRFPMAREPVTIRLEQILGNLATRRFNSVDVLGDPR